MADITPTLIHNFVGTVASVPAASTTTGPAAGDIGEGRVDSAGAQDSALAVFDMTFTAANGGDVITINKPASMPAKTGCQVTVTPKNATGITAALTFTETATQIVLTAAAAAAGAIVRVVITPFAVAPLRYPVL